MCFLLDHANSNSVFSGLFLFELKTVSLKFAPSSFTIRSVSNYFRFPLIVRKSRAQLNLRTQTIFWLSLLCAENNVWEPAREINSSDVNFYQSHFILHIRRGTTQQLCLEHAQTREEKCWMTDFYRVYQTLSLRS